MERPRQSDLCTQGSQRKLAHFVLDRPSRLPALAVVMLIAFRLAADAANVDISVEPSLVDRQKQLLSFAFYVVCAFTLVTFLNAITPPDWVGDLTSLDLTRTGPWWRWWRRL